MNTEETQKAVKWGRIALTVFAVFLVIQTIGALKALRQIDPVYNSISVSGEGEVFAVPDIATFSFSVSADAREVAEAQRQVTERTNALIDAFKSFGIEERDIKTTNYSIYPKYTYEPAACSPTYCPPSRQVQDGYTASHSISIKVRDTARAGEALALAGQRGATNISGISFTIDDEDALLEEARALAITDAKAKAKTLSKELGVKLVRVVSFYDNSGGGMPYYAEVGMGGDMRASSAPAPSVPMGENRIRSNVTVIYQIR